LRGIDKTGARKSPILGGENNGKGGVDVKQKTERGRDGPKGDIRIPSSKELRPQNRNGMRGLGEKKKKNNPEKNKGAPSWKYKRNSNEEIGAAPSTH